MEISKLKHWKSSSYLSGNTVMETLWEDWNLSLNEFEGEWAFRIHAFISYQAAATGLPKQHNYFSHQQDTEWELRQKR